MTLNEAQTEAQRRWGAGGTAWLRRAGGYDAQGRYDSRKGRNEYCVGVDSRDPRADGGYRAFGTGDSFVEAFVIAERNGYT